MCHSRLNILLTGALLTHQRVPPQRKEISHEAT